MSKIDDGGPAFPSGMQELSDKILGPVNPGLATRDYIAIHVLSGMMANNIPTPPFETIEEVQDHLAKLAYGYADSMLRARQEQSS